MNCVLNLPNGFSRPQWASEKGHLREYSTKRRLFRRLCVGIILMMVSVFSTRGQETVSFGTLTEEMTDMERLTVLPDQAYRMVQFSSYDRRSQIPGMKGWFDNSDGFGGEPIPGFEKVLAPPDPDGSGPGTYLICDVKGPGAILRLWTAGINGRIRLFLDEENDPVYDGEAEEFFWNTAAGISGIDNEVTDPKIYRQFDATYFPIPFSGRCRIEWTGDIKKIHFYHVGVRLYEDNTDVNTFKSSDIGMYRPQLEKLKERLYRPETDADLLLKKAESREITVPGKKSAELFKREGEGAIDLLSLKVEAANLESALRSSIIKIFFDGAEIPQVEAPLGDFFGAAPGLNVYISYPFIVRQDGQMICRFLMPFRESVQVVIDNKSDQTVHISGKFHITDYRWTEGKSMHFRTRWKVDHGLTASNASIEDIPYLLARGQGRLVGAAAFIYNPSEAVTSWGNWWGEGDEKIFIDGESFPSFFGTGSEDYFNYSWSAEHFFSYPYCGQPRNDGPGNRGYVSNFRWHISDDLPFTTNIAFYMELRHHGVVPGFSYGRIVYSYALPGCTDDYLPISDEEVGSLPYHNWEPLAYLGSRGYTFRQAEDILADPATTSVVEGKLWSAGKILMWEPEKEGDKISFKFTKSGEGESRIGITLAHGPEEGAFSVLLNGMLVRFGDREIINTKDPGRTYLRNFFSGKIEAKAGENEIVFISTQSESGASIGIDFFWFREEK